ncbi:hypothetical protein HAX54_000513 [Datura stramonium]|uniref:Uncharacterized protein n=1 Tax=Datura stramonium TaxID=4076 RepID=A0ABS8WSN9_DATST|nr:hypothetical protein [Datura stramonium]
MGSNDKRKKKVRKLLMANTHANNEVVLENQHVNTVRDQVANIKNRPIIDDKEEVDLEAVDLRNVNTRRGMWNRDHEEAVHQTDFDDIKESL